MKDGAIISEFRHQGLTRGQLVGVMGSIETAQSHRRVTRAVRDAQPVIRHPGAAASDLSIEVRPGEIVGFAGLNGHGQRQRLLAIHDSATRAGTAVAFVARDRVV